MVDMEHIRSLSWTGVPSHRMRAQVWKLLLGCTDSSLPIVERQKAIQSIRAEYATTIRKEYGSAQNDQNPLKQIKKDMTRLLPDMPLFQSKVVHDCLQTILYIWAVRNPDCGYVQGMDGLLAPFFLIFLAEHVERPDICDVSSSTLPAEVLTNVEADCFWCFCKLMSRMHDHYTPQMPGLMRMVGRSGTTEKILGH